MAIYYDEWQASCEALIFYQELGATQDRDMVSLIVLKLHLADLKGSFCNCGYQFL